MAVRAEVVGGGVVGLHLPDAAPVDAPPVTLDPGWRGKRLFDVLAALFLLLLLAPVIILTALAVKLTSRGPVFFVQRRVGRGGRSFPMIKFRTMQVGAEERLLCEPDLRRAYLECNFKIPTRADPRVTKVGRFLRVSSIDELPQLLNVLAGHMSLVGPRPVTAGQLADYEDRVADYLAVRPGLTGLWQVSGRNLVRFPERADIDSRYRIDCGPWLDLVILARTPRAVLTREGSE